MGTDEDVGSDVFQCYLSIVCSHNCVAENVKKTVQKAVNLGSGTFAE